jgi:hypothetical protein
VSLFDRHIDDAMGVCNAVFGDAGHVYRPAAGGEYTVDGIFEKSHALVDASGEVPVEVRKPMLCVRKSDLDAQSAPQPEQGDVFVIGGTEYEVELPQDDGHAEVRLVLMQRGANSHA